MTPSAEVIRDRHDRLLARLRSVTADHGHDPERLRIVGITKTWPVEVVHAARAAGLTALGENRVQEAEPKVEAAPDVEWHLVGRLQANKARRAVAAFGWIHSIDSVELLERVSTLARGDRRDVRLLLQVNVTGESQKAGFAADALDVLAAAAASTAVGGLMTIGRMGAAHDEARAAFQAVRELRDRLQDRIGRALPELSMGMSADAEAAAAEGATLVRIGTAIFGSRA